MKLDELVGELERRSIRLERLDDELDVCGDDAVLDPAFVAALRTHKSELLQLVDQSGTGFWYPSTALTPSMLPLADLSQEQISAIVRRVPGGAANVQDIYPLAPLQQGIFFHHTLESRGDAYLLLTQFSFDTRQRLDAFTRALQAVIDRHDILRTAIVWEGLAEPLQVVLRRAPLVVEELQFDPGLDAAEALRERFHPSQYRLDLRKAPMLRVCIAFDARRRSWQLLLLWHHLVGDHTTLDVMQEEIEAFLLGRGTELPPAASFRNLVAQARLGKSVAEHEAFFREMLSFVTEPTAPFGLLDVQGDGAVVAESSLVLEPALSRRLHERCRRLGVSAASLFHQAWALVLSRLTGHEQVVFGTVLFGRMAGGSGAERGIGLFINTLPIKLAADRQEVSVGLKRVQAQLAQLLSHEHAPLALAQRSSAVTAPAPLFTTLLNYRHSPAPALTAEATTAVWEGIQATPTLERTNYPITVNVDDFGDGFSLKVQVDARLEAARICGLMATALERLVHALEQAPSTPLVDVDILPVAERSVLVEQFNDTRHSYPRDATLQELFERQVALNPEAVALVTAGEHLSYAQLNARANQVAHRLRKLSVAPDARVAVCLERRAEMLVGLLGVLKSGGAYVPLDPSYPAERLQQMLEDSQPLVLLHDGCVPEQLACAASAVPQLDLRGNLEDEPVVDLDATAIGVTPTTLAYVIYTSGSTGRPKGVMVEQRGLVNLLCALQAQLGIGAADRLLGLTTIAFDIAGLELYLPLICGASIGLVTRAEASDPELLARCVEELDVTWMQATPATWRMLLDAGWAGREGLRALCGGEALPNELGRRLCQCVAELWNVYGPTETTIWSTACRFDPSAPGVHASIGKPLWNTQVYIFDARGRLAPQGVSGELYIGGDGVARGYLQRLELTLERFVPDPFAAEPGARLYKTGDLACWRADGTLEFLGRNDFQVKLRGYRIELGEIEARLREHAALKQAVVTAHEDQPGAKRLLAYFVATREISADELRAHLAASLPEYMIPSAFLQLEALPLTPNGKLDRKALPVPDVSGADSGSSVAPRGELENLVAQIWADVLRVEQVGRHDDFFQRGGHSLLAVQVISRLRHALGVEVSVSELFARSAFTDFVASLKRGSAAELPAIIRAEPHQSLPLSFAQQRLWFLSKLEGPSSAYQLALGMRLHGALDVLALRRALDQLVVRHEALRTTFRTIAGQPVQHIAPAEGATFQLLTQPVGSDAELEELIREESSRGFDLAQGPLLRGRLLQQGDHEHTLLLTLHHIVSDGWSMGVLVDEVAALYGAYASGGVDPLPALEVQYPDYAVWQRRWVAGAALERDAEFWKRTLVGAPALLELPTDHARPAEQSFVGSSIDVALDAELTSRLKDLSRRHGTTLFMTLLAGLSAALGRFAGQEDVVIGTPVANRPRPELERLIGLFVNTLPLRIDLSGAPTVGQLLTRAKEVTLAAQEHQSLPFEQMVELVAPARSLAHSPLFQVMLAWQVQQPQSASLPGLELQPLAFGERSASRFDLTFDLRLAGERVVGDIEYSTALFERSTVERVWACLCELLVSMTAPDMASPSVERLPMLPAAERRRVLSDWNETASEYPRDLSLPELFERQVRATPHAKALHFGGVTLSYAELDGRANLLARELVRLGVEPDVRVALCVPRGLELVVGVLAIMKAGGAYVPLDPAYPTERLREMVEDSQPRVLVYAGSLDPALAAAAPAAAGVDAADPRWQQRADSLAPLTIRLAPHHLAYVIYTSGSTGRPKGVMVEQRGLVNLLCSMQSLLGIGASDTVLGLTTIAFDIAGLELYLPLICGASIALVERADAADPDRLSRCLAELDVSLMQATPATWRMLLDAGWQGRSSLRALCGGEAMPLELGARLSRRVAELWNVYGPTETTIWSSAWRFEEGGAGPHASIGRPLANTQMYVLDSAGAPVPTGVAGELYIGGDGVARGYWNRSELTAERFVPDPFSAADDARLYRTGDLARWNSDGTLDFLGRNDFQVKLRGYRIELGEIEARLREHANVGETVVVAREDAAGSKQLVAYFTPRGEADVAELRRHLGESLPEYMLPSAFVRLEALPLTPNGKIDRKALPAPEGQAFLSRAYVAPLGEREQLLAELWCRLLRVERVGRDDNFFELGGHSLLAVALIESMRESGLSADVRAIFAAPTLSALAEASMSQQPELEVPPNLIPEDCNEITPELVPLVQLTAQEIASVVASVPGGAPNIEDIYPLAPLQEGILFHHLAGSEGDAYLMASELSFGSRAEVDSFLLALEQVIARQTVLRTSLVWDGLRAPLQVVWRRAPLSVKEIVLPGDADAAHELRSLFDPRSYRMDLSRAPLLKLWTAFDAQQGRWLVLLLWHHVIGDHTTLELIQAEIEAISRGAAASLLTPVPYRNFVARAVLGTSQAEHEAYFREQLGDVVEPTAPYGLLDVQGDGRRVVEHRLPLGLKLSQRLRARARSLGVTAASIHHLAWAMVLSRLTAQEAVVFGTVLFGRTDGGVGAARAIGLFMNTLPLKLTLGRQSSEVAVRETQRLLSGLLRHEHASLALAQRCSGVAPTTPLFTSLLNYRHGSTGTVTETSADQRASGPSALFFEERTSYPLSVDVDDLGDDFVLTAQTDPAISAAQVCELLACALGSLVAALEQEPGLPVSDLEVLPDAHRHQVLAAWNATDADFGSVGQVQQHFERVVAADPTSVALAMADERVSYGELNAKANQLARFLRERGVATDQPVGVCLERGIQQVVATLAVWKAGGCYLPLDASYPRERLEYMIRDAAPSLVLTDRRGRESLEAVEIANVDVEAESWRWVELSRDNLEPLAVDATALAYLIYTSGSTGTPKGVMIEHGNLVNYALDAVRWFGLGRTDRVLQQNSLNFDLSLEELVPALLAGAAVLPSRELFGVNAGPIAAELCPTVVHLTAAHFHLLLGEWSDAEAARRLSGLRLVNVTGDALSVQKLERWDAVRPATVKLINTYGPTETTVSCTAAFVSHVAGERSVTIGTPFANTQIYILDRQLRPVPAGATGELYVAGRQVGRGYLNRPDLTAERFVADPFSAQESARMYRSGDLARFQPDGRIEFCGRADAQLKVRGFRVEPGEIESFLASLAGVKDVAVVALGAAEKRLVAYYTAESDGRAPSADELRRATSDALPEYMVPAAYVQLERLPLTPNGKLDRKALPTPDDGAYVEREYEAPRGALEQELANIWCELLKVARVGRRDHFFELGGHSLLTVRVASRLRERLQLEVPIGLLFAQPILADLAAALENVTSARLPPIEPVARGALAPLSFSQQRLWFLAQLEGASEAYHLPSAIKLHGELNEAALRRALDRIVERHEVLRTTFTLLDGQPVQRVAKAGERGFDLAVTAITSAAELSELVEREVARPFDLERGPLLRGCLVRERAQLHTLVVTMHHIVSDGWSMGVLVHELGQLYAAYASGAADTLPALRVQYADFAIWQRDFVAGELLQSQARYWQQALAGAPDVLELPRERPRPPLQSYAGATIDLALDRGLTAQLKELSQRQGTTLFMTLLAGWAALLARLSGQQDVVIGTPSANRGRQEIENLIGFFVNTLALRFDLSGAKSVTELLQQVKARSLEAQANQDIPFEQVVELVNPVRSTAFTPLFQVMFAWQNQDEGRLELPGLTLEPFTDGEQKTATFDLTLGLEEADGCIVGGLEYATALFDRSSMQRLLGHYRNLLQDMVADPQKSWEQLELLDAEEREQLLYGWNRTQVPASGDSVVHRLFEERVRANPDAVALVHDAQTVTYGELNGRANQLAHRLRGLGVRPDQRIALCAERSVAQIVGILAILKAGAAYVPLDPSYPAARLAHVVEHSQAVAVLSSGGAWRPEPLAQGKLQLVDLDTSLAGESQDNLDAAFGLGARNLAYVIYTSGSTGTPKGVMVEHASLCNQVRALQERYGLGPSDRVLQFASFTFDMSVEEIFGALCSGAALVLRDDSWLAGPTAFWSLCAASGVTVANLPPLYWQQLTMGFPESLPPCLRQLMIGGDAVAPEALRAWFARSGHVPRLFNAYGPTEATVNATIQEASVEQASLSSIGKPLRNTRVYVLDACLQPVPLGVTGELYIGGLGVARGYLGQPELSSERFSKDPFVDEPDARLYRTSDLARWLPDGSIEFLGRADHQVKVRGYRIELGEIEARLLQHPLVCEAAVVVVERAPGDKRLAAYYSATAELSATELRAHLSQHLPDYMVPAALIQLAALPVTAQGKLDRAALPAPDMQLGVGAGEPPQGALEQRLAELWQELLGVGSIGRHDNFFELGGHSLIAVTLIERMRALGLAVDVRAIFAAPTLAALAATVGKAEDDVVIPPNLIPAGCTALAPSMLTLLSLTPSEVDCLSRAVPGGASNVQDAYPLAPLQQGMLFHHLVAERGDAYVEVSRFAFDSRARLDAFVAALNAVVARHDILRTSFVWEGLSEPVQVVWREAQLTVHELALEAGRDAMEQLEERFPAHGVRLDLSAAPLLQLHAAHDSTQDRWLLVLAHHHLIGDHTTLDVMAEEVAAHLSGRAAELPPPVPFRNLVAQAKLGRSEQEHAAFFHRMLGDIVEPTAPFGLTDVQRDGRGIVQAGRALPSELSQRLRQRARRLGVSVASLCHQAWALVLARLTGREQVVFGTVLFGRLQGGEGANRGIGLFINTLPIRVDVGDAGVESSARQLQAALAELLRYEHAPLALAQRSSGVPAGRPLFTTLFNYRHSGPAPQSSPGVDATQDGILAFAGEERSNYPITLSVDDFGSELGVTAQVDVSVGATRICELFEVALAQLVTALERTPTMAIRRVDVLPEHERRLVVETWNATSSNYPAGSTVHELFDELVRSQPERVAVEHGAFSLTYAELDARSNALAARLLRLGVKPGQVIALSLPRSPELVVAELAVLKAGAAYLPLDPSYPAVRQELMLLDAGAQVLLTLSSVEVPHPPGLERLDLDELDDVSDERVAVAVGADALAYVMYTSGSTGQPKGVMVPHRGITRLVRENGYATVLPTDRVAFAANPAFDASTLEVWAPLLNGGRIVIVDQEQVLAPAAFAAVLRRHDVSVLWLTVGLFNRYVDELADELSRLRYLIVGGDALDPRPIARLLERGGPRHLLNGYGPTETTTFALTHEIREVPVGASSIPLGKPIGNTRVYLLDSARLPVPIGAVGELYIGGAGVALGYLNRPDLTAERFVPDPFSADDAARLYRTGDLGRWNADGTVEFLGRNDRQIKLRGFRIELGEIEARIAELPGVAEALLVLREDVAGDKRLVAYVRGASELRVEALRAALTTSLPDYMLPSAFVVLDAFPLTANGKIDRRALPMPDDDAVAARRYSEPRGELEQALAQIWRDVLRVDRVGRDDDFFELGGHSLLTVQVSSRVREVLGVEVPVMTLFSQRTLGALAQALQGAARATLQPITADVRPALLPLSHSQQRLWFLAQLGGSTAYHVTASIRLRGALDLVAWRRALDRIVARHETLRTTFQLVDGQPCQVVTASAESRFALSEERAESSEELSRQLLAAAQLPFDLERGPLVRGHLIREAEDAHTFFLSMHHIISDGWSLGVLLRELSSLYASYECGDAENVPELEIQYADYSLWQRRWLSGERLAQQASYWQQSLAGAPALLELPTDFPRPAQQDFSGGMASVSLDAELSTGLKRLSQSHGATLFMTLLAGWAALLSRLSGQDEVVIGTPSANRGRRELEDLIGFFVNTLAVRVSPTGQTVSALLEEVKNSALSAQANQDIPFEQVVELVNPPRSLAHSPLFQVLFAWQGSDEQAHAFELPGLNMEPAVAADHVAAKFDLSLSLEEVDGRITGQLEYATALFEPATVERWLGYYGELLRGMVREPEAVVDRLALMPQAERNRVLLDWNATTQPFPEGLCAHQLFEAQVARTADAIAVSCGGTDITYAELNARANRLAHVLRGHGVGPDQLVAVALERSIEMVVAVLAIWKAGGAYIPLDPAYPVARIAYMLRDGEPLVALTRPGLLAEVWETASPTLRVVDATDSWEGEPTENLEPAAVGVTSSNLAYVIYTSGSTGEPKGVLVEHRGLVNLALSQIAGFQVQPESRVLQVASFSFDAWVSELMMSLACGATLVVPAASVLLAGAALNEMLRAQRISHATLTPAVLTALPEPSPLGELATLVVAGDALSESSMRSSARGQRLINAYGPTEASVCATMHVCSADDVGSPSIGRPLPNVRIYILDAHGQPTPAGVAGELCIGGVGVARGYHRRPQLTAERFAPSAWEPQERLYRSGDRARWRSDGSIDFLGRNDHQIKLRGFRIELGEIEARLLESSDVAEAAVLVREDAPGDKRLVAYVVLAAGARHEPEALRTRLGAQLPEYMVPAAFVALASLPLTPNGKLDRRALPAPEGGSFVARHYEPPADELERLLATIWSELLRVGRVGRHDNFFELGGHSLLTVQVASRLRQELALEVPISEFFAHPVLADFARALAGARRAELPPVTASERDSDSPVSLAQQRMWFLSQMPGVSEAYHVPVGLRLRGELNRDALRRALEHLVMRHESLRTVFVLVDGQPRQRVLPLADSGFSLLEQVANNDAELANLVVEEATQPFQLDRGPLLRARVIAEAGGSYALLVTMHHIVSDGWSVGLLVNELASLYAAYAQGVQPELQPLDLQYADYAVWQRRWLTAELLRSQAEYWKRSLTGAPERLDLPTDHPRPAQEDYAGSELLLSLDAPLTRALKELSRKHGVTLFMTLLSAWSVLLARWSGQSDVVIGTPSANRGRRELEGVIGFFVNTLPLRIQLEDAQTVAALLESVKTRLLEAHANQDVPFEQVVELLNPERSLAHSPIFQVMFAWQPSESNDVALPGLTLEALPRTPQVTSKFELTLSLEESDGTIAGSLEYRTALFEPETIARMLACLRRLLQAMVDDDQQLLSRLPLLPRVEEERVLRDNNATTVRHELGRCVHRIFEERARQMPTQLALIQGERALTYAELNASANRLAHRLRSLGVRAGACVAICARRSVENVRAQLAVLKAGGAYVPLDPAYPQARLQQLLDDISPTVLLADADLLEPLAAEFSALDLADTGAADEHDLPDTATPQDLAYVIYTSGSTGAPKGVMVEHRNLVNLIEWHAAAFDVKPGVRSSSLAGVGFDAAVWELWPSLCQGGTSHLPTQADSEDPSRLLGWWQSQQLELSFLPTPLAEHAFARGMTHPTLRRLLVGGDRLRELPGNLSFQVVNNYGPTEATVVATSGVLEPGGAVLHIGRPIHNTRVYVLDAELQPVPTGVAGELYIAGAGVARGYWRQPAQTSARFLPDPFVSGEAERMYRTGDVARWRPDGTLEFLGRNDSQVKIRGFRIELGEIEARLLEHPQLREVAVVARDDEPGRKRLVAYFTSDAEVYPEPLREHLAHALPEYMQPAAFVRLSALPLTPNGKLDRRALPAPEGDALVAHGYEPPRGEVEELVAGIWSQLLRVERVGRHDNFFELGGHSLLAVTLIERLRERGLNADVRAIFLTPTLAGLAATVEEIEEEVRL